MKEFLTAALPFLLAGCSVAVICAGMDRKKTKEKEKRMEQNLAVGAGLGLLIGSLATFYAFDGNALLLAVGPLCGMALATILSNRDQKKGRRE